MPTKVRWHYPRHVHDVHRRAGRKKLADPVRRHGTRPRAVRRSGGRTGTREPPRSTFARRLTRRARFVVFEVLVRRVLRIRVVLDAFIMVAESARWNFGRGIIYLTPLSIENLAQPVQNRLLVIPRRSPDLRLEPSDAGHFRCDVLCPLVACRTKRS